MSLSLIVIDTTLVTTIGLPGNMAAYLWASGPAILTVFYLQVTLFDDGCDTVNGERVCPLGIPYLKVKQQRIRYEHAIF